VILIPSIVIERASPLIGSLFSRAFRISEIEGVSSGWTETTVFIDMISCVGTPS